MIVNKEKQADKILRTVATHYGLLPDDIRGKKRDRQISEARRIAIYLIKKWSGYNWVETGKYISRDHSIIIFSCNKVEQQIQTDSEFKDLIHCIEVKLGVYGY